MLDIIIPTLKEQQEAMALIGQITATAGCPVNVIATCQKVSAAKNRNLGLKEASSEIIFMLDDDITGLPEGWVVRMLEVMWRHPNCVMCSPRLLNLDGTFGIMVGWPTDGYKGCEVLPARELLTACIAVRKTKFRFDENFIGSGFEDNDYCRQLRQAFPAGEFICTHDLLVVHKNEKKNQRGDYWTHNREYFRRKWARSSMPLGVVRRPRRPVGPRTVGKRP